jgi:hypothetical protein
MAADEWIRNVGQSRPALVISQEPGAAAQGNPALAIRQADTGGAGIEVRSAGTLLDLQTPAGVSRFKVSSSGVISGAPGTLVSDLYNTPSGTTILARTIPPWEVSIGTIAPASGTIQLVPILLAQGTPVANITFMVGGTAKTGGTNGWYVLCDSARKVVTVSANQTDAATTWGTINALQSLPVTTDGSTVYSAAYSGLFYIGVMVAQSAGTTPTFAGGANYYTNVASLLTAGSGQSNSGQTTPPAAGTVLNAIASTAGTNYYAHVT